MLIAAFLLSAVLAAQSADRYYWFPLSWNRVDAQDYGLARLAPIYNVGSIAIDPAGNLYFPELGTIQKITPEGMIEPLRGVLPFRVGGPVAADPQGNLFVADANRSQVFRLSTSGTVETWVAPGAVQYLNVLAMAAGNAGELYIVDYGRIWRVGPDRSITTFAGTGTLGFGGDSGPATEALIYAQGIAVDPDGTVYIADTGNDRIRAVDTGGIIRTVAGISRPEYVLPDGQGHVYVSSLGPVIYKVDARQLTVQTVAGGAAGPYWGDGGPAANARLAGPRGLVLDKAGNLYFADSDGYSRIRRISPDGTIATVAGCSCAGDGAPVTWLTQTSPFGVAIDHAGRIYFSDRRTHEVRRIGPDGVQTIVAGNGEAGFSGDGGPATSARLAYPAGLAFDPKGDLYIADEQNNRIRMVTPDGTISTIAGNGTLAFSGDGGKAVDASLGLPDGVAADAAGNIYIADSTGHRVRRVGPDGIITTVAGSGAIGSGGPAIAAQLINPRGLAFDTDGGLLISDSSAGAVRKLLQDGTIRTLTRAVLAPYDAVPDGKGNVFIAGWGLGQVLRLDGQGVLHTISIASTAPGYSSIGYPTSVATARDGTLYTAAGGLFALTSANVPPFPITPMIGSSEVQSGFPSLTLTSGILAPGEIIAIHGLNLGPANAVTASPAGGSISTALAGVRVLFDEIPGPVLYAVYGQVESVVPFEVAGRDHVTVRTEFNALSSNSVTLAQLPALPAFGPPIDQDGTENSGTNPARRGSVISLYGTGGRVMSPPLATGQIAGTALSTVAAPVSATVGGAAAEVLYAGSAPGFIAGALQVNVRIPPDTNPAAPTYFTITIGGIGFTWFISLAP